MDIQRVRHLIKREHESRAETLPGFSKEDVKLARAGNEEALFRLIRADPRFLASGMVQAKVALWRLRVMYSKCHFRSESKRVFAVELAKDARKMLKRLAAAVSFSTGKGQHNAIGSTELKARWIEVRTALKRASVEITEGRERGVEPDPDRISERLEISIKDARTLVDNPASTADLADTIVAAEYGNIGSETVRKRRSPQPASKVR